MKKLLFINIILLLVCIYSFYVDKLKKDLENNLTQQEELQSDSINKKMVVKLLNNNIKEIIELEEYIIGVIACEMPASFETEALKANAVAARTYAMKKMKANNVYDLENSTNNQCYINNEQMKEKWGKDYQYYFNKIKDAVGSTKGEYITYNGEIISAFYFSTSNGFTENSENVFSEKLEYLRSTESSWDKNVSSYLRTTTFTVEEFTKLLNLKEDKIYNIEILSKFESGRINKIKINNKTFKGTEFRKLLSIRSTDFEIKQKSDTVIITTRGYGHGVGLSQYGANEMAKLNYTYEDIIKYYYKNVEINSV